MRARNIKPGFFCNEELAECTFPARILFAGLWCLADREGYLEDRPKKIKIQIFPADSVDCEALLCELSDAKLIARYPGDDGKYIWIPSFRSHQNPHRREKPSKIPPHPEDAEKRTEPEEENTEQGPSTDSPEHNQGQAKDGPGSGQGQAKDGPGSGQGQAKGSTGHDQGQTKDGPGSGQGQAKGSTGHDQGQTKDGPGSGQGQAKGSTGHDQGQTKDGPGYDQGQAKGSPEHNQGQARGEPRPNRARLNPDTGILNPESGFLKEKTLSDESDDGQPEPPEEKFYLTAKKKKLTGKRLETFEQFWDAFDYKHGKASAADSWLAIPELRDSIVAQILTASRLEAQGRQTKINNGGTPKMAQGWLAERRWEDDPPPVVAKAGTKSRNKGFEELVNQDLERRMEDFGNGS
ncbi:hypothetical protein [Desulfoluna spongiiphila]|uniref:hypothetical protein n=1 Tax=Desulfoluna spongiiphila TaxID=419481 RepID=UPI00125AD316|nr:hypothetical protein [Desulfoluna spongiiphila]VVS95339.1 consensus disorder prediction [Desulfoluna spongiiphila]